MVEAIKPLARVLIVDDESDIGTTLRRGLEQRGFNAVSYTTPVKAMDDLIAHPNEFCAILSDVRMPGITGFELARASKSINANVKVILMSAFEINMSEYSKVAPSGKIDDFITKPASIQKVSDVLLKHIGNTKRLNANAVR